MAWHRPGDEPLFEPKMVILLTHICVTRPQWISTSGTEMSRESVGTCMRHGFARHFQHLDDLFYSPPPPPKNVYIYTIIWNKNWPYLLPISNAPHFQHLDDPPPKKKEKKRKKMNKIYNLIQILLGHIFSMYMYLPPLTSVGRYYSSISKPKWLHP